MNALRFPSMTDEKSLLTKFALFFFKRRQFCTRFLLLPCQQTQRFVIRVLLKLAEVLAIARNNCVDGLNGLVGFGTAEADVKHIRS